MLFHHFSFKFSPPEANVWKLHDGVDEHAQSILTQNGVWRKAAGVVYVQSSVPVRWKFSGGATAPWWRRTCLRVGEHSTSDFCTEPVSVPVERFIKVEKKKSNLCRIFVCLGSNGPDVKAFDWISGSLSCVKQSGGIFTPSCSE